MHMKHPLKDIVAMNKRGMGAGIYSACTANSYVIEACMESALQGNNYLLVEATANQVNKFGGYTGMKPSDFCKFIHDIARKTGFPQDKLILGGDHLGPLVWKNENSREAMKKADELIRLFVLSGFTKIHIDTSMHLGDDDKSTPLDLEIIAGRGARLCKFAEEAFKDLLDRHPGSTPPVYVIGSEVPIPGGAQEEDGGVQVTRAEDFENTVKTFRKAFMELGLEKAWENVIAVVVQPGVEFGDDGVHEYDREAAKELCKALSRYPGIVFEGHSTDYQAPKKLKQMVEDGIAILKVGPALTFALREALFALNHMEEELFRDVPGVRLSRFIETLDEAMLKNPENWEKHYHGDSRKIAFARKYSYSDRCRYYLPDPEVRKSIDILIKNLNSTGIPLTLVSQYMPIQYNKIRDGLLENKPETLLKDRIINYIDDYMYAVGY
ncbi:MAG: class II D-tagatose-bisphosphate aldolase, non-catalytic subunit [Clostridiaceae bacterium]|nr:class II D-tagatose-bisphosphate aldolase, non-catalytic subunit [Clostridiaceae bacterium]